MSDEKVLGIDLQFMPDWAKGGQQPRHEGLYREERDAERGGDRPRRDRAPDRRGDGPIRRPRPPRERSGGRGDDRDRPPRERRAPRPGAGAPPPPVSSPPRAPAEPPRVLPFEIAFHPEPRVAAKMGGQIRKLGLAFPLFEVARMFLRRDERFLVQLRAKEGSEFWQIKPSGEIFLDRGEAEDAAFRACRAQYYLEERVPCEPPKGNWQTVMRCRLDGTVLPPVNHHSHHDQLQRLWKEKFPSLSLSAFRDSLETVRDEEAIKRWLEGESYRTTWKRNVAPVPADPRASAPAESAPAVGDGAAPSGPADAAPAPDQPAAENAPAEAVPSGEAFESEQDVLTDFRARHAGRVVKKVRTAKIAGVVARKIAHPALNAMLGNAWEDEVRFPINMANRLRSFFQEYDLKLFKSRKNMTYVGVARPSVIDPDMAEPSIAAILKFVIRHPGCSKQRLMDALAAPVAAAAATSPAGDGAAAPGSDAAPAPDAAAAPVPPPPATATAPAVPAGQEGAPALFPRQDLLRSFGLVIRQGYVIEFSNRHLAPARDLVGPEKPHETPAGEHAPAASRVA